MSNRKSKMRRRNLIQLALKKKKNKSFFCRLTDCFKKEKKLSAKLP